MKLGDLSTEYIYEVLELLQFAVGSMYHKKESLMSQLANLDKLSLKLSELDEKGIRKMREVLYTELDRREKLNEKSGT